MAAEGSNISQGRVRVEAFCIMRCTDVSVGDNATFVKDLLTNAIDDAIVDLRLVSNSEPDSGW